jgi:hypothetical protein
MDEILHARPGLTLLPDNTLMGIEIQGLPVPIAKVPINLLSYRFRIDRAHKK